MNQLLEGERNMKSTLAKKTLIISAIVLLSGAALAFAHGGGYGRGYGGHMMGHGMGYGPGHPMDREGYGPHMRGYGCGANLSDEDAAKLNAARDKFFAETRTLRQQIDEKRLALRSELSKEEPDSAKAAKVQKELSQLESDFDQKALQHRIEMRQLLPEGARGRGYGYGRGGDGYGRGGGCW
jgi:zinc resistance-associated protein